MRAHWERTPQRQAAKAAGSTQEARGQWQEATIAPGRRPPVAVVLLRCVLMLVLELPLLMALVWQPRCRDSNCHCSLNAMRMRMFA